MTIVKVIAAQVAVVLLGGPAGLNSIRAASVDAQQCLYGVTTPPLRQASLPQFFAARVAEIAQGIHRIVV